VVARRGRTPEYRASDERDEEVWSVDVEIWSDVVCPWCYVGKRQFEAALDQFAHADQVTVAWRSFELDPSSPPEVGMSMDLILQRKYGMSEEQARMANERMTSLAGELGLEYHLDRARAGNTFDAHRLIHLAATHGLGDAVKERLFAAYFTEGRSIGDRATLTAVAEEAGLDRAEVEATLEGDAFADGVRADEARAAALGATGVPFFVIDETYGVAGAQGDAVLLAALERAWSESHPITMVDSPGKGPDDGACADGVCAV
jgi:predicted DsbA family dithiol-disulfide isomerase